MIQGFGSVERVPEAVRERFAAKKTLFGFGHPVYVTMDPRARILKRLSEQFSHDGGELVRAAGRLDERQDGDATG